MTEEKVRLPRSSYEELCRIIKAYGQYDRPASLDEVSAVSAMGRTSVSANNAFLAFAGIVEGGNKKVATARGRALARALEHGISEETEKVWKDIVETNEFLTKMGLAVRIRRSMEPSALVAHIAFNAGEKKTGAAMTGARAVIDILRAAHVISEEDGLLVAETPRVEGTEPVVAAPSMQPERRVGAAQPQVVPMVPSPRTSGISVNIEVRIDAKPDELGDLGVKLKHLLASLSEASGEESTEQE